jgi:glycosyltransferase involved in cell wall biosynthesis
MSPKPDILFIHSNFPGQFGFLAEAMKARGHRVAAIAETGRGLPGVSLARWSLKRGSAPGIYPMATRAEADLMRASGAADAAFALRENGINPALIIGHPGWGETIFMREIFPQARQILYGEYYYRFKGGDAGFDPEFPAANDRAEPLRIHAKNATQLLAYADADAIVSPTPYQAGRFPELLKPSLRIVHEGVDTAAIKPNPQARLLLPNGQVLDRSTPVITFINRRFEPLRGYHIFMRALPAVLKACPTAQVVMIGADQGNGYGLAPPKGKTWKEIFLAEVSDRMDMSRVHFTGTLPHDQMLAALSISAAHVYYTYPFVLSWSLLEAMASGCALIASDTAPVRDALTDGVNARLLPFFDIEALSEAMIDAVKSPERYVPYREQARHDAVAYHDRATSCLPQWMALIDEMLTRA